ncbi:MAG: Asp-tRNA(Asn)/Glu-tRNA(Gln) amidotransferase subunit GatB [Patescibacteria group bacterium]|nr:Asp-tRNA(Asn)/Glu-tRNA(Gln) amidotransferase subunit GatB [Patescibacteria group bacterium]
MDYDVIIGMEIHAELKTKRKMFCACDNDQVGKKPNENTCPLCLGHPGTLPVPNKEAIDWTILLGLALHGKINLFSKFDRKNYFYPDLPKGYQISQYDLPFVYDAKLKINDKEIEITRVHLEEDTGKNTHPNGKNYSLIDFNRSGTPLSELVTEPVIKSGEEAKKFCQRYQQVLRYLDISNADMEKGEMRCEANISLQEKDKWERSDNTIIAKGNYKLNPKIEVKNINSFKAVEKAIDYEIKRQSKALEQGKELSQETRGWNEDKGMTISQRIKENSADYRYFPDPDIPPIKIDAQKIKELKSRIIELPSEKLDRFISQYNLSEDVAELIISNKDFANYTEEVISELRAWINSTGDDWQRQKHILAKSVANWLTSELLKHLRADNKEIKDIKITPENFAELITLIYQDKIGSSAGQQILDYMYKHGGDPTDIMRELNLEQMDNNEELEQIIEEITVNNEKQVEQYREGKTNVLQYFVGQTMAKTKGKANPKTVIKILKKILD